MKKVVLLLVLVVTISLSAVADVAVTMVSYEQRWLDSVGTLALRNNSEDEIKDVQFRITYLDMNDSPMDYEDYSRRVSIAPGMVRKVDIPAYEHGRFYHYYRTPKAMGNPTFKIRFKLLSHNLTVEKPKKEERPAVAESKAVEKPVQPKEVKPVVVEPKSVEKVIEKTQTPKEKKVIIKRKAPKEEILVSVADETDDENSKEMEEGILVSVADGTEAENPTETKLAITEDEESQQILEDNDECPYNPLVKDLVRLFLFGVTAGLFAIVGEMARRRNRNAIRWIVLSMFLTPLLMILILLFLGDNKRDYYFRP